MKKIIVFMLALLILLSMGCGIKAEKPLDASSVDDTSGKNGKIIITLGAYSSSPDGLLNYFPGVPGSGLLFYKSSYDYLKNAVGVFNNNNEQFEIKIIDYGELGGETFPDRLSTDIITGNMPDILLLNGVPYKEYTRKEIFMDLSTVLDTDGLFPGLLSAMMTDGGLYFISPENIAVTWFGLESITGSGKLSFSDIDKIREKYKNSGAALFNDSLNDRSLTGSELFRLLYSGQRERLINDAKGTCSFISQDFYDLFELCRNIGETSKPTDGNTYTESLVMSGELLFGSMSITEREYYQSYKTLCSGKNIKFFGIPGADSAMCIMQLPLAVSSKSSKEKQKGACQFIQSLINREYSLNFGFLPLSKNVFDRNLNRKFDYFNSWKDKTTQPISYITIIINGNKTEIETAPFEQEDYDNMISLINSATTAYYASAPELSILNEEVSSYLNGSGIAEDCAETIQQRLSIYLSEQS